MRKILFILIGFLTLSLIGNAQSLKVKKRYFVPGEIIKPNYTVPNSFANSAWVGIVKTSDKQKQKSIDTFSKDLCYKIEGTTNGKAQLTIPEDLGDYEIRMYDNTHNGNELCKAKITVVAPETSVAVPLNNKDDEISKGESSMQIEVSQLIQGQKFAVNYQTPPFTSAYAWIGMYTTGEESIRINFKMIGTNKSGTIYFYAPKKAGKYELRMFGNQKSEDAVYKTIITVK